ncbi:hypothetical protein ACLMJK_005195 [Lecanora helva]
MDLSHTRLPIQHRLRLLEAYKKDLVTKSKVIRASIRSLEEQIENLEATAHTSLVDRLIVEDLHASLKKAEEDFEIVGGQWDRVSNEIEEAWGKSLLVSAAAEA